MSVVIRLSMVGKTHQRSFRVSAKEKRSKRDGKFLEILGSVNPSLEESKQVVLKKDRITFWQKQGAQLSPTVAFLVKNGKLPPRPKKDRGKKEAATTPQPENQKTEEGQTAPSESDKQATEANQAEESKQEEKKEPAEANQEEKVADVSNEQTAEPSSNTDADAPKPAETNEPINTDENSQPQAEEEQK